MRQQRILLIDSEVYVAHLLEFSLNMEGYQVVVAGSGEQAMEWITSGEQIDLAIVSADLPDCSALELCRTLSAGEAIGEVPIFLLAAADRELDEKEIIAAGVSNVLKRPVNTSALMREVKATLSTGRAETRNAIRTF